ncbi:MAG: FAD-dependent oxidoreductase [Alphaproteobacteria bacterium HGW-Alphaproteobacteria-2]|nr:MAG: FAD-dependent oxidoreductase [Alphaproteobacteria bacterium HGW-Alphaproteobacteria-2]
MGNKAQQAAAELDWRGAVPVSRRFGDPYFSLEGGLAETRHVFLDGNGLPERFRDGFHIVELGFGSGLNLVAALRLWRSSGQAGRLRYTGFEAFPMTAEQMARALATFPELAVDAAPILAARRAGTWWIETPGLAAEIVPGDARVTLPAWKGRADAWFLDGFAPARNPELWGADILSEVFAVVRAPGYGRKRHMTRGRLERA